MVKPRPTRSDETGRAAEADGSGSGPNSRFPGGGGSLRDSDAHKAVLAATAALLREVGYARLTVESIAQRAGVAKPTIYRWWPNKAAIVHETIWAPARETVPDTGDLAVDLRAYVASVVEFHSRPEVVAALPGLVTQALSVTDETTKVLAEYRRVNMSALRTLLSRAQERGDIGASADLGMVSDIIIGTMISRILARSMRAGSPTPMRPSDVEPLVNILLVGIRAER